MQLRRVVTGHDANGRAVVVSDENVKNVVSARPGASASVIWTTEKFPVNNDGNEDTSQRATGTTLPNGTVFRVVEIGPGGVPRIHRTDSVDTIHAWVNKGTEPCTIAFVLIDAKSVTAGGKVLHAEG